jgi:hypothetical protein
MTRDDIGEALDQVRTLKHLVTEKQLFYGYSGIARMASGTLGLAAAALMSSSFYPQYPYAHLAGWGIVFGLTALLNYGAVFGWFLSHRNAQLVKPAFDALPHLFICGILTMALMLQEQHNLLFGVWMSLYGLIHLSCHHVLPKNTVLVGMLYLACGTLGLLNGIDFLNPWPMGVIFFAGEWAGGIIYHFHKRSLQ